MRWHRAAPYFISCVDVPVTDAYLFLWLQIYLGYSWSRKVSIYAGTVRFGTASRGDPAFCHLTVVPVKSDESLQLETCHGIAIYSYLSYRSA